MPGKGPPAEEDVRDFGEPPSALEDNTDLGGLLIKTWEGHASPQYMFPMQKIPDSAPAIFG